MLDPLRNSARHRKQPLELTHKLRVGSHTDDYSALRTVIGLTLVARHAGSQQANIAIPNTTAALTTTVT